VLSLLSGTKQAAIKTIVKNKQGSEHVASTHWPWQTFVYSNPEYEPENSPSSD